MERKKIVFFGSGPYVHHLLDALHAEYEIALIVTTEVSDQESVVSYAKSNSLPLLSVKRIDETVIEHIEKLQAPVAVLAYFGLILPEKLLNIFPYGIINTHPSLLPKYRGPTPGQAAILKGDTVTGVTIIKLDKEVDHGPILMSQQEPLNDNDTSQSLYERLFKISASLLTNALKQYLDNQLELKPQDHTTATFTEHLTRQSGYIDFSNPPKASQIDRMIRAYYPWPTVWFMASINGVEKRIKLLPEQKIQVEGKNVMSFKDFLNGYAEGKEILNNLNLS